MILGKQKEGRELRGSTFCTCSKTFATLPPIFCTGEIFSLSAMLLYLTPHFTAHTTRIYFRTYKLLPPGKSDFSGALHTH
jgi:hypothetical protein